MNKRLLLALSDRSGLGAYMPVDYRGHELEVEKHIELFTELIVRECLEQIDKIRDGCEADGEHQQALGADWAGLAVARHFGVEE